ncbi:MAG TPA: hypothetical protein VIK56_05070 [Rhodoferax sp.]
MSDPILIAQHGTTECFLRPDKGDLDQPNFGGGARQTLVARRAQ